MSWGLQANSHVANGTGMRILAKLTTQSGFVIAEKIIEAGKHEVVATPSEYITLKVYRPKPGGGWNQTTESRSLPPDSSFIVEQGPSDFKIFRAKYGNIWVKDVGVQGSDSGEVTSCIIGNLTPVVAAFKK